MKHTPGEWKIAEERFVYALNERGENRMWMNVSQGWIDREVRTSDGVQQIGEHTYRFPGMTLRDYFAITLLAGDAKTPGESCDGYMEQRARVAYAYADAMLKARQA